MQLHVGEDLEKLTFETGEILIRCVDELQRNSHNHADDY